MVLAGNPSPCDSESATGEQNVDSHPYLYAQVLGIFHADVQ
jgi:hypothetical protein